MKRATFYLLVGAALYFALCRVQWELQRLIPRTEQTLSEFTQ